VTFIARSPFALLVSGDSKFKTLKELDARSKAEPGKLTLGNEGPRAFSGMIARLFDSRTRAGLNLVPYANVGVGTHGRLAARVSSGTQEALTANSADHTDVKKALSHGIA
jgi:tripartite-type tricarboxylate transporter receptor subunit TctC